MEVSEAKLFFAKIDKCEKHEKEVLEEIKSVFVDIVAVYYIAHGSKMCRLFDDQIMFNEEVHCLTTSGHLHVVAPTSFSVNKDGFFTFKMEDEKLETITLTGIKAFSGIDDYLYMSRLLMSHMDDYKDETEETLKN